MECTARAIIKIEDYFILMKRVKIVDGISKEYYTTIGGHVEEGESFEQACLREVEEEIGVRGTILQQFYEEYNKDLNRYEKYYLVELKENKLKNGNGPEFTNPNFEKYGSFEIVKIKKQELSTLPIKPDSIKQMLADSK